MSTYNIPNTQYAHNIASSGGHIGAPRIYEQCDPIFDAAPTRIIQFQPIRVLRRVMVSRHQHSKNIVMLLFVDALGMIKELAERD